MTATIECGVKCFSERKTCCKDLQRWSRNLLYMIGLEDVAKQFAHPQAWKDISPFLDTHTTTPSEDWTPCDQCPVCSGKRCPLPPSESEPQCQSACDASSSTGKGGGPRLNFDFLFSNMEANNAQYPPSPFGAPLYPNSQPPNPFQNLLAFQHYPYITQLLHWSSMYNTQSMPNFMDQIVSFHKQAQAIEQQHSLDLSGNEKRRQEIEQGGGLSVNHIANVAHVKPQNTVEEINHSILQCEQPLDLSIKPEIKRKTISVASETKKIAISTKNGVQTNKAEVSPTNNTGNSNGKRNYSQVDLEAAVKDIRSGRLGTRRASVVYGIPRSTLRNKIYKLEAAEDGTAATTQANAKKMKRTGIAISTSPLPLTKNELSPPSRQSCETRETSRPQSQTNLREEDSETQDWATMQQKTLLNTLNKQHNPYMQMTPEAWSQLQHMWSMANQQPTTVESQSGALDIPRRMSTADSVKSQDQDDESSWNKKTRPKRGQYRKYDKNALQQAVQSVRKGEMSVHRAGSFYGVPHSTLEYKVKERNLMRNKKKVNANVSEETQERSESGSMSPDRRATQSSSIKPNEGGNDSMTSVSPSDQPRSPLGSEGPSSPSEPQSMQQINGAPLSANDGVWANYPQSNFFASEMIRRLQAEANNCTSVVDSPN